MELARSISDPFNYSSCIPDGAHGVGKFTIKQMDQIATGTGTAMGFALACMDHVTYSKVDTASANATPTFGGNWTNAVNSTAISALYSRTRLVSAGIRATYTGTTTNDSGVMLLGQVPASVALSVFNSAPLASALAACSYVKSIPLRQGSQITWRPCDYDDQGAFNKVETVQTVASTGLARPWLICLVYGAAANGAGSVLVESVSNWEGQFQNPTFSPGGQATASGAPAEPGWFELAQNATRYLAPIVSLVSSDGWPSRSAQPVSLAHERGHAMDMSMSG